MSCECVNLNLEVSLYKVQYSRFTGQIEGNGFTLFQSGSYNNFRYYNFQIQNDNYVIWYDNLTDTYNVQSGILPNNGGQIHLK